MLGLADYGSDTDGSSDEDADCVKGVLVQNAKKIEHLKTPESPKRSGLEDFFFGNIPEGSSLNIPSVSIVSQIEEKDETLLEDIVKPKDWEKKLADKTRRKLEKKLKKKKKKEKKKKVKDDEENPGSHIGSIKKEKKKAQISLFGALSSVAMDDKSDSEDERKKASEPSGSRETGLLSMLPAPKTAIKEPGQAGSILLPPSLRNKKSASIALKNNAPVPSPTKRSLVSVSDSEDSDTESTDFFGLSVKEKDCKIARLNLTPSDVPIVPSNGLDQLVGPSRPQVYSHPSEMYNMAYEDNPELDNGKLSNAEAHRLIVQHESNFGGKSLGDTLNNIVDVSVNDALGPNVHATLMKNLSNKAIARSGMVPLPKAVNIRDSQAKRKHQITYLAQMAVAREEALQEQRAEARNNKRMTQAKYGFTR